MSRGSLSDAVRAAGYALATSEELLGISSQTTVVRQPEARNRGEVEKAPQAIDAKAKLTDIRTLRSFFGSFAVWA